VQIGESAVTMTGGMDMSESPRTERRRQSLLVVGLEFAVFAGVYLADWTHHVYLSKIPYLLVLAWLSLRFRGLRWRDIGFALFRNWPTTLALGVLAGVGMEAMELFCTQPLLASVFREMPNLSVFDRVQGDNKWALRESPKTFSMVDSRRALSRPWTQRAS
jgi:hypothetical protein